MAFPAGLPLVTVNCRFDMLPNGGADGFARFVFTGPLTGPGDDSIVHHVDERRALDDDGECTVALPPTDAPGWVPQDFEYTVYAGVGEVVHQGRFTLTVDTLTVNLADVVVWSTAPADPGVVYATLAQLTTALSGKADTGHTHEQGDVDDLAADLQALETAVDGKAAEGHGHAQTDVSGLTTALSGKADTGHTHEQGDVDDLTADLQALETAVDGKLDETGGILTGDLEITGTLNVTGSLTGEVVDSTLTVRKSDNSSALRFRSTGGAVDVDKISGDVVISSFANSDFTGTQTGLARLRDTGITVAGLTEFGDTVYGGQQAIDGAGGTARLGAKNSLTNLRIAGYKATPGAPTTGTWDTGDTVMATDGIWRCMTGGTPGVWRCMAGPEVDRIVDDGEVALGRLLPTGQIALTTEQLLVTHWTAQVTETILTFRTAAGDTPSLATGTEHAWVGVMRYDGTVYTPEVQSVDDTTLWSVAFADYETPLFDAATVSVPGFNKVAGVRYASWVLWVGSGDPPQLAGKAVWAEEPYREPRLNGYYTTDTPPSVNLNAEWFAPDWRLLQHHLKR